MKASLTRLFGLTKNEIKIVKALGHVPLALHEIEDRTKLSHASVSDTLKRLVDRGLVDTLYNTKRKKYTCTIENRIDCKSRIKSDTPIGVEIYEGKEELLSLISSELIRNKGKRLYSFHGEEVAEGWLKILPPEEVKKRNDMIIENDILVERFVPIDKYKKLFRKFPIDWQKTMVGRTHITYFLPDTYFKTKTELMMFPDVVMLYETHKERITIFRDIETIKLYEAIFEMMRKVGVKINSEEEFKKYF